MPLKKTPVISPHHHPATQLGQLARSAAPLVQLPPRGTWRGVGGVVYDRADRWTGHSLDRTDRLAVMVSPFSTARRSACSTIWLGVR